MSRPVAAGLLILTTMLWGFAFVAQKTAMDSLGPLTFSAARYLLGTICIIPLALWEYRRNKRTVSPRDWGLIAVIAISFFFGVWLQQAGLTMTTVTNAGFLTSIYVLFVPVLALVALLRRPHPVVWLGMPLALLGVYFLNGARFDSFNLGDLLIIASALAWAVQILLIGIVSQRTGLPVTISIICFAVTTVLAGAGGLAFEAPRLEGLADSWVEIVYGGVFSTAIAFTLQAVAQQYVPPSNAAIILSAEGLFAALGGALLLHERLPWLGYVGAAMIFAAIVLVEVFPMLRQRGPAAASS
jgi:drug/metabolite transporter (DMT)-like permease